jgi:hypothetical protein
MDSTELERLRTELADKDLEIARLKSHTAFDAALQRAGVPQSAIADARTLLLSEVTHLQVGSDIVRATYGELHNGSPEAIVRRFLKNRPHFAEQEPESPVIDAERMTVNELLSHVKEPPTKEPKPPRDLADEDLSTMSAEDLIANMGPNPNDGPGFPC